jgi:hypothetical protein
MRVHLDNRGLSAKLDYLLMDNNSQAQS